MESALAEMENLLEKKVIPADKTRDSITGSWSTIGVVATLVMTMIDTTMVVECDRSEDLDFDGFICVNGNLINVFLLFIAFACNLVVVIMATVLYVNFGLVDDGQ